MLTLPQLFVFLKVLGVASSSHVYYQAELTRRELREVFSTAKADPTVSEWVSLVLFGKGGTAADISTAPPFPKHISPQLGRALR